MRKRASQARVFHVFLHAKSFHIWLYLKIVYTYTYTCEHVHVYKEVQSWSIRKGTNKCESAQHRSIYQRIRDMILEINKYIYLWVYVHKRVLSVSTRKGTDICEFAQHEVIHKSICNRKFVNLWVYLCIQRNSNREHSQGHRHMWVRTTQSHTQKYL